MSISHHSETAAHQVQAKLYYPLGTVRCDGPPVFRSQSARDIACLFDVDDSITTWSCMPVQLRCQSEHYHPDFLIEGNGGIVLVDAYPSQGSEGPPAWVAEAAEAGGYSYETIDPKSLPGIRLKNAKDLLRYARFDVALSDRVRLLAILDEQSGLSVAECLTIFQETKPIAGLASLVLHRFIEMDLDEKLIGPETQVRRYRD